MTEEQKFDWIEQYLDGKLNAEEEKKFQQQLKSDPSFKATFQKHKLAHQLLEDGVNLRLKSMLQDMQQEQASTKSLIRLWPLYVSIAAGIILLVVVGILRNGEEKFSDPELFAMYFEAYPANVQRGTEGPISPFQRGILAYSQQDYRNADSILSAIHQDESNYIEAQLYLGISLLAQGDFAEASTAFQQVILAQDSRFSEAASWYLALAYLGNGETDALEKLSQNLLEKEGFFYKGRLESLLNRRE